MWYAMMFWRSSAVRLAKADPTLLKASLLGAKMVMFRVAAASTESVALMAPRREVRLRARAVSRTLGGKVRTRSMMWIVPPVKFWSCSSLVWRR
jgi:hypothetical protein